MFKNLLDKIDRPWLVLFITVLAYLLFIFIVLFKNDFNPSYFISAGDKFIDKNNVYGRILVADNSWGYDGQFYYRLALDPFTQVRTAYGLTLDLPSLRQQRLIYPLLAALISVGNKAAIPAILLIINFIALGGLGYVSAKLFKLYRLHALTGLLISFYPGFLLVLARDLAEIFSVGFLALALYLYKIKSYPWLTIALTLAVLTRETNVLLVAALILYAGYQYFLKNHKDGRALLLALFLPLFAFCAWHFYLYLVWGTLPFFVSQQFNLVLIPLTGLLARLTDYQSLNLFSILELGFLFSAFGSAIYFLKHSRADLVIKIAFLVYGLLLLFFSQNVWTEDWNFFRVVADLYLLSIIIILTAKSRLVKPLAIYFGIFTALIWLRLFLRLI